MPSTVTLGIVAVLLLLLASHRPRDLGHARTPARAAHRQDDREDDHEGDQHDDAHQSSILSRSALVSAPGERSGERQPMMASTPTIATTAMIASTVGERGNPPPVARAGANAAEIETALMRSSSAWTPRDRRRARAASGPRACSAPP